MAQSLKSGSSWIAFDIGFRWDNMKGDCVYFELFCLSKYGVKLHPPWDDKGEIIFTSSVVWPYTSSKKCYYHH